jgi:hypothetical protein
LLDDLSLKGDYNTVVVYSFSLAVHTAVTDSQTEAAPISAQNHEQPTFRASAVNRRDEELLMAYSQLAGARQDVQRLQVPIAMICKHALRNFRHT